MAKNLKLNIKNTQIAQAINLGGLKSKIRKKKEEEEEDTKKTASSKPAKSLTSKTPKVEKEEPAPEVKEEAPRIKARSKSAFAASQAMGEETLPSEPIEQLPTAEKIFIDEEPSVPQTVIEETPLEEPIVEPIVEEVKEEKPNKQETLPKKAELPAKKPLYTPPPSTSYEKLGPTGRHIKDLLPKKAETKEAPPASIKAPQVKTPQEQLAEDSGKAKVKPKAQGFEESNVESESETKKTEKSSKFKEFKDYKPSHKTEQRAFDSRDRQGLRASEEEGSQWRKKRHKGPKIQIEDTTIRPSQLKIRVPISIKDLASEMKLKASQLVGKLFLQGVIVTLNDLLEDETTIQLLGNEFGCDISIDTSEEKRLQITDKTVREEISASKSDDLIIRPPVVTFMGHVDHGKTSLIDAIRKSNRAAGEAGAITQHIGAFKCHTNVGDITILDTPGHEAFSAMRARGADVTDIVVLVVAGDEGMRQQTLEAIQHARAAKVTIIVAINKCDKPNFNAENVYRQLADIDLLPESWGGQIITINCSAVTGEGIPVLLEMLALQAEVLELKANPQNRARGRVIESEMHKGLGAMANVLVQNGTLRLGDALVFDQYWGHVKTMHNEYGKEVSEAGPSTPVEITGLSGLPEAGQEFIVVKNEKEARSIAEARMQGIRQSNLLLKKKVTMESLLQQASETDTGKKILNILIRADVQGSLEALKAALLKLDSKKVDVNIIFSGVGEISESDVQLAAASKALIVGFHTKIESHAEQLIKQYGVQVISQDIIYHAIDDVKRVMGDLLDKIAQETEKGKAVVLATFKASNLGVIAGCQVTEGSIHRNYHIRLKRGNDIVWKGSISSLKRLKEDVREVQKGLECGILLNNFNEVKEGDILEAYEITYLTQEL